MAPTHPLPTSTSLHLPGERNRASGCVVNSWLTLLTQEDVSLAKNWVCGKQLANTTNTGRRFVSKATGYVVNSWLTLLTQGDVSLAKQLDMW